MNRLTLRCALVMLLVATPVAAHAQQEASAAAARLGVRISELEQENRELRGQLERSDHEIRKLRRELKVLSEDVEYRLQSLEQRQPMLGADANEVPAATPAETSRRSMQQVIQQVSENTQPPVATPPAAPAMDFKSPQDHYSHAFTLINRARYADAEQVLRAFTQQYPKDRLVGNAYYWLGETHYVREDYLQAADAFRQGFEVMPQGRKAPDNLLKLAMSLGKLGKKDQACVVLSQVQVKYKGKAESVLKRAATERAAMGCR